MERKKPTNKEIVAKVEMLNSVNDTVIGFNYPDLASKFRFWYFIVY